MTRSRSKHGGGGGGSTENLAIVESPSQQWTCSVCHFETNSSTGLRKHARAEHNKCIRCRIMFSSAEEFQEHLLRANCSQKVCFVCKLDFSSEASLVEHRLSCHEGILAVPRRMPTITAAAADDDGCHNCDDPAPDRELLPHVCDFCTKNFEMEESVEAHLQSEHHHCFPCSREFSSKKALVDHMKSSTRHHYCLFCETDFLTSEALTRHRYSGVHEDPAELRILRPSAAIRWHEDAERLRTYLESKELSLKRNQRIHHKCGKVCEEEVEVEIAKAESDEYTKLVQRLSRLTRFLDQLEECNPEYASIVKIQKQVADGFRLPPSPSEDEDDDSDMTPVVDEFDEEVYCCSLCNEEFDSRRDREFHEYDNHQWCSVCNRQYASRRALVKHIESTRGHNFCFECCQVFFLKDMLVEHRKTVWHATSVNKPLVMSDKGVSKKVYVCDDCQVYNVYSSEHALQSHLEKNHFSCLECDRRFKSRKALLQHYQRSKRHHFCAECEMNLPSRSELEEHLLLGKHRD
ncbi:hypothetical protein R1flu_019753 [Riccia fluitans]|uniref:C2H2-type domain-containing protein n=1 Tax=Riccia fluitans TaxID=41844 RepID=A0ABD1ZJW3_9MARC